MTDELKRYKITITVTTRDGAFDQTLIDPIWAVLDAKNGERLDSVSLPIEIPPLDPRYFEIDEDN